MTPSDQDLVALVVISDDREGFGELVARHQVAVRAFLCRLCRGDHATAEDLAQETFLCAHRQIRRYHGGSRFSTWLIGIAYNLWRNHQRHHQRFTATPPETGPATEDSAQPQVDLRQDLATAIAHLSAEAQAVLHLYYFQDLSHQEIADALAWPVGTVKTHLHRAKTQLRSLLTSWNTQP